jgi:hypothetical protein
LWNDKEMAFLLSPSARSWRGCRSICIKFCKSPLLSRLTP